MRRVLLYLTVIFVIGAASRAGSAAEPEKPAPQSVAGTVKDALGRPLPDVSVTLQAADGRAVSRAMASAAGAFSFTAVAPGTYAVVA